MKNMDKSPTDKLRVLCFHGYRQSGDSFKSKTGSLRKFVGKYADFEYITAPHLAPPLPNESESRVEGKEQDGDDLGQRSWWFNKDDGSFKGTNKSGPAIGFGESLRLIEKEWESGRYQGLMGFSQGASLVGLICHMSMQGKTTIKPQFAILSSGFRSQSLVHINFYEHRCHIPSLHIFGETDEIIPRDMSKELASSFVNKEIITHPGGHYFPATAKQKQSYINFFQDQLQEYLEAKELENVIPENLITLEEEAQQISSDSD